MKKPDRGAHSDSFDYSEDLQELEATEDYRAADGDDDDNPLGGD